MEDTSYIVTLPSLDVTSYFNTSLHYVTTHYPGLIEGLKMVIGALIGLSIPICVLLFLGIIITMERLKSIRKKEEELYEPKAEPAYSELTTPTPQGHPDFARKWAKVLELSESQNSSDWRQAVLEADILLGEILTHLGYQGEGIGEQLKRADKGDFKTLQDAWEAHKVRNEVAHAGSDFAFNQYDARQTIQLYRKVFEEFFYI